MDSAAFWCRSDSCAASISIPAVVRRRSNDESMLCWLDFGEKLLTVSLRGVVVVITNTVMFYEIFEFCVSRSRNEHRD